MGSTPTERAKKEEIMDYYKLFTSFYLEALPFIAVIAFIIYGFIQQTYNLLDYDDPFIKYVMFPAILGLVLFGIPFILPVIVFCLIPVGLVVLGSLIAKKTK